MLWGANVEYPAPTKAMWETIGQSVAAPKLPNRPNGHQKKTTDLSRNAWTPSMANLTAGATTFTLGKIGRGK